jgi:hypothetical protein
MPAIAVNKVDTPTGETTDRDADAAGCTGSRHFLLRGSSRLLLAWRHADAAEWVREAIRVTAGAS